MGIEDDPFLAWQFDRAVWLYGDRVDGLLQETKKVKKGKGHEFKPKYTLKQALRKAARRAGAGSQARVMADFARFEQAGTNVIDD